MVPFCSTLVPCRLRRLAPRVLSRKATGREAHRWCSRQREPGGRRLSRRLKGAVWSIDTAAERSETRQDRNRPNDAPPPFAGRGRRRRRGRLLFSSALTSAL